MSHFSSQKGYCFICGKEMSWHCNQSYIHNKVCGKECNEEFKWRETLSIMGRDYYPRPSSLASESK